MSENSKIEWTDHTFNPWWGCEHVGAGCLHCYAERHARRFMNARLWGPGHAVRLFDDGHWAEPLVWNKAGEKSSKPARVFCASMCDVFEDHPDVAAARHRLWALIADTPHLIWMLLTKRPQNIPGMFPSRWFVRAELSSEPWPSNVWIGCSASTQDEFDKLVPHIDVCPAPVRFVSIEPLLAPIEVFPGFTPTDGSGKRSAPALLIDKPGSKTWVIVGGESGPNARPMHPSWVRDIRDQCIEAGVPFFFKQWGRWAVSTNYGNARGRLVLNDRAVYTYNAARHRLWALIADTPHLNHISGTVADHHKEDWTSYEPTLMVALEKRAAGRLLDGRTWDEVPSPRSMRHNWTSSMTG